MTSKKGVGYHSRIYILSYLPTSSLYRQRVGDEGFGRERYDLRSDHFIDIIIPSLLDIGCFKRVLSFVISVIRLFCSASHVSDPLARAIGPYFWHYGHLINSYSRCLCPNVIGSREWARLRVIGNLATQGLQGTM